MWEKFFQLKERIFTPSADAKLPLLPTQQAARDELLESLADGQGIILLVGESGVGKTRLLTDLAHERVSEQSVVWMPPGTPLDVASLYQSLLFDIELPWLPLETVCPSLWENTCRLRFGEWLLAQAAKGDSVLILADDVQDWPDDVLREWRTIIQFAQGSHVAVQAILSAKPRFLERLASDSLSEWANSLGYCVWLEPLSPEQAREHLSLVLARAGGSLDQLIEAKALEILIQRTRGIVQVLHQVTLRALHLAFLSQCNKLHTPFILAALEELGLISDDSASSLANSSAA